MRKAGRLRASRRRSIERSINCTAKRRRRATGSEMRSQAARISCALRSAHYHLNKRKRLKEKLRRGTRGCATKDEVRRRTGARGLSDIEGKAVVYSLGCSKQYLPVGPLQRNRPVPLHQASHNRLVT